ncbi:MAG: VOC family protein [Burkholderiaceae bacterium]|nr:VOC family protein [Burkholderiaceae bacterium]
MTASKIFHQLHHVCVVVRDLDAAVAYYESLGVGPWHDYPSLSIYELSVENPEVYRQLRYRYANLGNFQLQLCQPGEGDTPQRRFLKEHGEGVFHLGFGVESVDQAEREGLAMGLGILSRGRLPDRTGFTYFDTAQRGAGVTLEVRRSKLV